jgi:hypothetical protein
LLVPHVMKRSVGVNAVLIMLSLAVFTSFLGLVGALLAIPTAAILQLLIERVLSAPAQSVAPHSVGRDQLSRLSYETRVLSEDVRKRLRENHPINAQEQEVVDAIESISTELDQLLSQANPVEETT